MICALSAVEKTKLKWKCSWKVESFHWFPKTRCLKVLAFFFCLYHATWKEESCMCMLVQAGKKLHFGLVLKAAGKWWLSPLGLVSSVEREQCCWSVIMCCSGKYWNTAETWTNRMMFMLKDCVWITGIDRKLVLVVWCFSWTCLLVRKPAWHWECCWGGFD